MRAGNEVVDKVLVPDVTRFNEKLKVAMQQGMVVFRDGVAYWAEGSGQQGRILQHLPLKEISLNSLEEAIKAAQMTTVLTSAVSTSILLGALVVQTQYLSAKLDAIQRTVDHLAQELHSQNVLYYMDKVTEYLGGVEVARNLLRDRSLAMEIREVAYPLMSQLAAKRNHVLLFTDNIQALASDSKTLTPEHYRLVLQFMQLMLDVIPGAIHTEHLLACRVDKPRLGEQLLLDGAERYERALVGYKRMLNLEFTRLTRGELSDDRKAAVLRDIEQQAAELFQSAQHRQLLELPGGRVASLTSEHVERLPVVS